MSFHAHGLVVKRLRLGLGLGLGTGICDWDWEWGMANGKWEFIINNLMF